MSNCLLCLNDECLGDVVKDHAQIILIFQELEHQDCLEQQQNRPWAKTHPVRRRHAEPEIHEERLLTDKKHFSVAQRSGSSRNLGSCRKRSRRETMILLEKKKKLCANSIDGVNYEAIQVTKNGQMKKTVSSGASWKVTMTTIVRTSC